MPPLRKDEVGGTGLTLSLQERAYPLTLYTADPFFIPDCGVEVEVHITADVGSAIWSAMGQPVILSYGDGESEYIPNYAYPPGSVVTLDGDTYQSQTSTSAIPWTITGGVSSNWLQVNSRLYGWISNIADETHLSIIIERVESPIVAGVVPVNSAMPAGTGILVSSDADKRGAVVLLTGTTPDSTSGCFSAKLQYLEALGGTPTWGDSLPSVLVLDLNGRDSMFLDQYEAEFLGWFPAGDWYVSQQPNNQNYPLTNSSFWSSTGTQPSSGMNRGAYNPNAYYASGDYVQKLYAVYSIGSTLNTIIEYTADLFVIPAVGGTVDVTITTQVETPMWDVDGVTILINDGTHLIYGWVSAIISDTEFTFTLTRDATNYAAYNSGTTYATGDEVIYDNVAYTSLVDSNTGNEPDTSPDDWSVGSTMAAGAQCIISGDPYPPFTDTPHNLLDGAIDQDTVAASVVEGDLVFGNATPKWDRLPIGSTSQILTVVDGLPAWAAPGEGSVTITTPDDLITNNFTFDDATLGLGDSGFMTTDGVSTLTFHDASASNSGTVNTSSQEFSGLKTFLNDLDVVDTVNVFDIDVSSGDYSSLNYTALGFVLDNATTSLITGIGSGGPYEASPFYGILESAAYSYWADGTIAYQAFTELTNLAFPAGAPTVGYDSDDNIIYGVSALWLYNNSTGGAGHLPKEVLTDCHSMPSGTVSKAKTLFLDSGARQDLDL